MPKIRFIGRLASLFTEKTVKTFLFCLEVCGKLVISFKCVVTVFLYRILCFFLAIKRSGWIEHELPSAGTHEYVSVLLTNTVGVRVIGEEERRSGNINDLISVTIYKSSCSDILSSLVRIQCEV